VEVAQRRRPGTSGCKCWFRRFRSLSRPLQLLAANREVAESAPTNEAADRHELIDANAGTTGKAGGGVVAPSLLVRASRKAGRRVSDGRRVVPW
jgi:hypothetical protein